LYDVDIAVSIYGILYFDETRSTIGIDVVSKIDIASAQFYRPVGFHSFYFTALRAPVVHS
jgi:hypothetical protein